MWSVGCILGEMLLGSPIFPGTSTFNQLERILKHIPQPSKSDVDSIQSHYGPSVIERASSGQRKSLEDLIPNISKDSIDLIRRLLQFNPNKRITAEEALTHPYVINFHNLKEEISKGYDVVPQLNDNVRLTIDEYRNKLYQFIQQTKQAGGSIKNSTTSTTIKKQQPKSEAFMRSNSSLQSTATHKTTNEINDDNINYIHNSSISGNKNDQNELFSNPKIAQNYSSSYNNSNNNNPYENKSDNSDDTSSTVTPPHHNYYNQFKDNNNNNSTVTASNYNKKKSNDYYANPISNNEANNSSNYLGGVSSYTGVAFGRTTHSKPQPVVSTTSQTNIYTKNHQRSIAAARQRSMENLNATMVIIKKILLIILLLSFFSNNIFF
jgi:serine/threonine protein kinase